MLNAKALIPDEIQANKLKFLKLVEEIDVPGADTAGLVGYLDQGGFFDAPASTKYHANYAGGLCQHSLNVYYNLVSLYDQYKQYLPYEIDKNSLIICGLFHDISKTGFYEKQISNKKIYNEQGTKHDNMGKFDWVSVESWKVVDATNRFLAGTHEENSVLILGRFIPLCEQETVAIMNHHMHTGDGVQFMDQTFICDKYPLAVLLHMADYLSTFLLEGPVAI